MRDLLFKLRVLRLLLANDLEYWRREIWRRDPDELYCCNGRECACGGDTVRDLWSNIHDGAR